MKFIHKLLIISGVFILGVILICYAFFMVIVNPNPLMIGNWDVSEASFGDVPEPFAIDAEHFTFYANDTVQVIDTAHDSEWFFYALFMNYNEVNGMIVFSQGDFSWSFQFNSFNMDAMNLTNPSCPACSFEIVRVF